MLFSTIYPATFGLVTLSLALLRVCVRCSISLRPTLRRLLVYRNVVPHLLSLPTLSPGMCLVWCLYYALHVLIAAVLSKSLTESGLRLCLVAILHLVPLMFGFPIDVWSRYINITRSAAVYGHFFLALLVVVSSLFHISVVLSGQGLNLSDPVHFSGLMVR